MPAAKRKASRHAVAGLLAKGKVSLPVASSAPSRVRDGMLFNFECPAPVPCRLSSPAEQTSPKAPLTRNQLSKFIGNPFRDGPGPGQNNDSQHQGNEEEHGVENLDGLVMHVTFAAIQTQFQHAQTNESDGDEVNEHQGSAFGRIHAIKHFPPVAV